MATVTVFVPNISCGHCVHTIQTELAELDGVTKVEASGETKLVTIEYEAPATIEVIEALLAEINYPVQK